MNLPIKSLPFLLLIAFASCQKEPTDTCHDGIQNANETGVDCGGDCAPCQIIPAKVFENLSFTPEKAYFSTDGSMSAPVDAAHAKSVAHKIDITYIYNHDYSEPGFMDPVARSKEWYWDDYRQPWLYVAKEVRYYATDLKINHVNDAKADQSKIAEYLADDQRVRLAPHGIFEQGTCIGGRQSFEPESALLYKGYVFGFEHTATGKKGLLYIRKDQHIYWPYSVAPNDTKVDIVMER